MAPSVTPFELLPDEMVISILEFVGARDRKKLRPGARLETAKELVRAQLVCRRFERLTHQVESLDWPLRSEAEGRGLINFLKHESFSVERLNLIVSVRHEEMPQHLISSSQVLKRLPKRVSIFCINPASNERNSGVQFTLADPEPRQNIVESLLSGSSIETFGISPLPYGLVVIKRLMQVPNWSVKHLDLSQAATSLAALKNLLQRCIHIESLKAKTFRLQETASETESDEDQDEDALVVVNSGTLRILELAPAYQGPLSLDIQAPNLLRMDVDCGSLKLDTPLLQSLKLEMENLWEQVVFVQPCTRLTRLRAANMRSWTEDVVPIIRRCPSLETLTLNLDTEAVICTDIPVGRFLSELPSGIRTLNLVDSFLSTLRLSDPLEGPVLSSLRHLQIEEISDIESYFMLRRLCQAMPNLQRLEVAIGGRRGEEAGINAYFRKDFEHISELDVRIIPVV